jgi:hypothetical protein
LTGIFGHDLEFHKAALWAGDARGVHRTSLRVALNGFASVLGFDVWDEVFLKQQWSLDELIDHWTLTPQDLVLLEEKTAETKLLLAVLLKAFPLEGCFPNSFESISMLVVDFIARQLELPTSLWFKEMWNRKSGNRLRVTVRKHHGFRQYVTHDDQPTPN